MPDSQSFSVFSSRRHRATVLLEQRNIPALLVSDLKNIQYLTGFSGSNAALLLGSEGRHILSTDGRYDTQIRLQTGEPADVDIVVVNDIFQPMLGKKFSIEASLPVSMAEKCGHPDVVSGLVEELRLVKDESEIDVLRTAGHLADSVWEAFLAEGGIKEGITELEAAAKLEYALRMSGADGLSFDTILASGVNGAKPHAGVSQSVIVPGLVTVDFGVYYQGYASDQTRTVCVGEPDEQAAAVYDTVYRAQKAGEAILKPGVKLKDVDTACRSVIEEAGYGQYFVHSTGHGVGLDVHEAPRAAATVDDSVVLVEGMTLTVEPGIYIPGQTGCRIENTYVITADGAESLNPSPTELRIV